MGNQDTITLPELESMWRWPRLVSPSLDDLGQECLDWSASFTAFDAETQSLVHEKGKLSQSLVFLFVCRLPVKHNVSTNRAKWQRSPCWHVLCEDDSR